MTTDQEQAALAAANDNPAELLAATSPAKTLPGAIWNPLVMPMIPDAKGETLVVGQFVAFHDDGPVIGKALGKRLGSFGSADDARSAIERHILAAGPVPPEDHLIAADMLALISDIVAENKARQMERGTDRWWLRALLGRADEIIAAAEGKGIRAQSFNDRERDLLAANNRLLERSRSAEARADHMAGVASRALDQVEKLLKEKEKGLFAPAAR